jgi:hypothetical protein
MGCDVSGGNGLETTLGTYRFIALGTGKANERIVSSCTGTLTLIHSLPSPDACASRQLTPSSMIATTRRPPKDIRPRS